MVYATTLAAELRKRRMQLALKTTGDTRPTSKSVTGSGSAEEPVIIIDLSSEDEDNPGDVYCMKDSGTSSSPNKRLSLEPDAKKAKVELPDTLPAPIVDDALLSSIPMPKLSSVPMPKLSSIPMPKMPPSVQAATVEQNCLPVVVEEKLLPVPVLPQEQHSTPVDEQKISPATVDQNVTSVTSSDSDALYAFKRLTELPMPPASPDDECESPSEDNR